MDTLAPRSGTSQDSVRTLLILAGGTGGHVYPALAVAEQLRNEDWRVVWLGTPKGLEAQVVPSTGIEIYYVGVTGLRGKGALVWVQAPIKLGYAVLQCMRLVYRLRPQVVLGMGGFVAGPGGVAAWCLRKPLLVHEQNAIPGVTNRLLAHLATYVMEAFPGSFSAHLAARHTGNPLRQPIQHLPGPSIRFMERAGPLRLLVLGGSQGARALNEVVPYALADLKPRHRFTVRHQVGGGHFESTQRCYHAAAMDGELTPFIENMAEAYAWADLVISRAGAMTIAEIAAAGIASILVPYPFAVDDHQTANASYLAERGAALLVPQRELTPARLSAILREFSQGRRSRLLEMANIARGLAVMDATAQVAGHCVEMSQR